MYRLLAWILLVSLFSCSAWADDSWLHEPQRFQRHAPARPIGEAEGETTRDLTTQSKSQQPPNNIDSSRVALAPPADALRASHESAAVPGATASSSLTGGAPFQVPNRLPSAATLPREPLPAANTPLPISRSSTPSGAADSAKSTTPSSGENAVSPGIDSLITVAASLGIVLGLFFVLMWCFRRGMPKSTRSLPPEVVEVLGRAPLSGKQQMHLIRFGNKLVLAAISPAGIDTISEITDPAEANRLAGYCEQTRAGSATASFRGILDRLDNPPDYDGATDSPRRPNRSLASMVGLKGYRAEEDYV